MTLSFDPTSSLTNYRRGKGKHSVRAFGSVAKVMQRIEITMPLMTFDKHHFYFRARNLMANKSIWSFQSNYRKIPSSGLDKRSRGLERDAANWSFEYLSIKFRVERTAQLSMHTLKDFISR